jgi:mannose-6-phosphate isomerase-like protein (cupin superfamily)
MLQKVNLAEKLTLFSDFWNPRIVAELNNQQVKLVKISGKFTWHSHADEDELFLVLRGKLIMDLKDQQLEVFPGEFIVVPKGTEHCPAAEEETHILLFEPVNTRNTGDRVNEFTREELDII